MTAAVAETTKATTIIRDFSLNTHFIPIASSIKLNPKMHLCSACFPPINDTQCFYFHTLSGGRKTAPPGKNLHASQWNLFVEWSCLLMQRRPLGCFVFLSSVTILVAVAVAMCSSTWSV